ncbi:mitochondrial protein Pet127-domain-containing protein [Aspergillus falconensis]
MFRSSLRSASDPIREHVCFSCIARGLEGRAQARTFYATALLRGVTDNSSEITSAQSLDQAFQTLTQTLEAQKRRRPQKNTSAQKTKKTDSQGTSKRTTKPRLAPRETKRRREARPQHKHSEPLGIKTKLKGVVQQLDIQKKLAKKAKNVGAPQGFPKPPTILSKAISTQERGKLDSSTSAIKVVDVKTQPVPELSFGLQRVLFNPGVYQLRDPRSRVYNFDPYLGTIMPVTEFDFASLKEYITSSRDDTLRNIAKENKRKYMGSSSSMTSVLSHFHYLLSAWRPINTASLSRGFEDNMKTFTRIMRAPAAMFLRYQDGIYAIDADKGFDTANILMNLGKSMEKLLTLPKEEFERYRRSHENKITAEEEAQTPESYHYSTLGDFMMRSQLDAYDPRLPGTGMFDLKTRAVVSIRMDARNFEEGLGYEIKSRFGRFESYEREYYDMIRSAFLKYSLQVRIGRMDGIFVAFHNIERIFGFQYVSLAEMDETLHGTSNTALGDAEFRLSLQLWNKVLDKATKKYPGRSLRFHFEARETVHPFMYIFFEPVTDEEICAIQTRNKAEIDAYQQRILNLPIQENQNASTAPSNVQDIADATTNTSPESQPEEAPVNAENSSETGKREVSAIFLTVLNYYNGKQVNRVDELKPGDKWTVEYEMSTIEGPKVQSLYEACVTRRQRTLMSTEDVSDEPESQYIKTLREFARKGREYRKQQDEIDKEKGVVVLDDVKL